MPDNPTLTERQAAGCRKMLDDDAWRIFVYHSVLFVAGLVFVGIAVGTFSAHPWQSIFVALLWALACQVSGGFLGFLFAIPKTVATDQDKLNRQQVNTNLEQVADWLTKILLGAGLVELKSIPGWLRHVAGTLSGDGTDFPCPLTFGISLMIFFVAIGFMGSYLLTRLYLAQAFSRALAAPSIDEILTPEQSKSLSVSRMGFEHDEQELPAEAAAAAREIVGVPFESLTSWQDFAKWGKAQLDQKNISDAIKAYQKAISLAPGEPQLRLEFAVALYFNKAPIQDINSQLLAAYKAIGPFTNSDLKKSIYKSLLYNYLYMNPPDSFNGAIKYGEEYTGNPKSLPSGGLWVNLACAYGQKARWLGEDATRTTGSLSNADEQTATRAKALDAIKQALQIDNNWKTTFQMLMQKNYAGKDPAENDLEPFENDAEFRQVLSLPVS